MVTLLPTTDDHAPDVPPARPAATVMLIRDIEEGDADGLEVFVLERSAAAIFAAGFFVFPGGRVDDADGGPAVGTYSSGLDDEAASAMLGIPSGGLAYWVAAIRECFEEAGLLLARRSDGGVIARPDPADRVQVHDGALSMVDLCRRDDLVLDTGALRYVAHWVTPEGERPRRFDTRFFLAAAPDDQVGAHDDTETVASRWVRPDDALVLASEGLLKLMPPTVACLQVLAEATDVADALARAEAAGRPPRILPLARLDDDGRMVGVETELGYFAMPDYPNR